jgi:hypothetical protein
VGADGVVLEAVVLGVDGQVEGVGDLPRKSRSYFREPETALA